MAFIAWFDQLPDEGIGLAAGGKGASLCRLSRNGFPIPEGFIVCAGMFNHFMAENRLWERLYQTLDTIDWDDGGGSLSNAGEVIRAMITGAHIPPELAGELIETYSKLGNDVPVAVRSSGTAEDLDDASFAGVV